MSPIGYEKHLTDVYSTQGITDVASVTELRTSFQDVVDAAREGDGVIVQRNNEPYAVLMTFDGVKSWQEKIKEQERRINELESQIENR